jgi:HD-GYP domain-containing protein (c-di-GMP phosphodiesterase class II)
VKLKRYTDELDVFDAPTTARPYRAARSTDVACDVLTSEASKGWRDRVLVDAFGAVARVAAVL